MSNVKLQPHKPSWDAFGRLTGAVNGVSPKTKLAFAYYPDGRRASKKVYRQSGQDWALARTHQFYYDGWNLVAEKILNSGNHEIMNFSYTWGLDLAGQRSGRFGQEAGGIGGLLAVTVRSNGADRVYLPVADANGNICKVVDAQTLSVAASFEYDPFGKLISESRPNFSTLELSNFHFRFSSKYFDAETGLYYYGYRYYDPASCKWLCRDPLQEQGGVNLTAFCGNDPVNKCDPLGLWAEGGHYYTVLYVALAAGYSKEDALTLAFFAQYPDYVKEYAAWDYFHAKRNVGSIGLYSVLKPVGLKGGLSQESLLIEGVGHSLLGCEATTLRKTYARNWSSLSSLSEQGMVLHYFGDLYAHSFVKDGKDWLYPNGIGHASDLSKPDHVGEHYDQYEHYVNDLYELLKNESGGKANDGMIKALLSSTKQFSSIYTKTRVVRGEKGQIHKAKWYDAGSEKGAMRELAVSALGSDLPEFNPGNSYNFERILKKKSVFYGIPEMSGLYDPAKYVEFLTKRVEPWSKQ